MDLLNAWTLFWFGEDDPSDVLVHAELTKTKPGHSSTATNEMTSEDPVRRGISVV
jgi:hypothetical protein